MLKNVILLFCLLISSVIVAQKGQVNTNDAKIRACESLNCSITTTLKKGEICEILSVSKFEELDNYGNYPWFKVKTKQNQIGFIYGALINLINNKNAEIKINKTGYIREENVNVRLCGGLKCKKMFQLPKGTYCKVISKTKKEDDIGTLGKASWFFIEANGRKGYIFSPLISLETNQLIIDSNNVKVYDKPNGQIVQTVNKGEKFEVIKQSEKSELIRPYGRYYWYEINDNNYTLGWIFGAFTSKSNAPVDCQCVDYVKKVLSITGSTKNAFEWEDVLYGQIPVTINEEETFLSYKEIYNETDVEKGDIAIFDLLHPEADNQYGHIGIVNDEIQEFSNGSRKIPLEGGNHKVPLKYYFTKNNCNNVSNKLYLLDNNVRFFRPDKK